MTATIALTEAEPSRPRPGAQHPPRPPAPLGLDAGAVHPDTLAAAVLGQADRLGDGLSVRFRRDGRWVDLSWRQMRDAAAAVAVGLVHAGLAAGDRLALLSENRIEWLWADSGAQLAGVVVVPVYASSVSDMVGQIISDSGAVAAICSTPAQARKVLEVRGRCPALRHVVLMEGALDGCTGLDELAGAATAADVETVRRRIRAITPQSLWTIIYTSGTTGAPKGVMLTHANAVGSCRGLLKVVPLRADDHGISFLPWAHVFERCAGIYLGLIAGVSASIAPNLDDIGGDLRASRPTIMNGVPRIYEKMQEAIESRLRSAGGRRAALGRRAIADCTERARRRRRGRRPGPLLAMRCALWERLVIARIRRALGGRLRVLASGGGPINIATLEFFDALGIVIAEGYGLTETTGGVTANSPEDPRFGTVGRATEGHELRIAGDGEILVRGPGVMRGYFNNEEATSDALHDGWFATGDIGELDADGYLRITDRKKDLIVTAGGKNIAPAPIEALLSRDPLVERAIVLGDRRRYLVALVVPEFGALEHWALEHGVSAGSHRELAADPSVRALYEGIAEAACRGLARYETVKRVAVVERDLEEARGEITPTLKVRRSTVEAHFASVIEALYA